MNTKILKPRGRLLTSLLAGVLALSVTLAACTSPAAPRLPTPPEEEDEGPDRPDEDQDDSALTVSFLDTPDYWSAA